MIFLTWSVQIRQLQQLPSLRWLRVSLHVPYHGWLFQRGEQLLNMDALVVTAGNYAIPHPSGCVQFYTINDIIPLIMGRKECTPTLFPASVMEAGWVKNSARVHQSPCLLYIGKKECIGVLKGTAVSVHLSSQLKMYSSSIYFVLLPDL